MTGTPDISVIVIGYNDAAGLPPAVESVLDQSLRNVEIVIVDDASTDAMPRVADQLAAAHPDRIRVIHRPENSGGCGEPRNDGIAIARGTYVMFLDSGDTLDRHACRNMFVAGEETGADLVSACTWRVYPDTGEEFPWYRGLYRDRAVYSSINDKPDLLYDTLATNKAYRGEFLDRAELAFVPKLHYEDLLFSAQAYLSARTITTIPHRVYNWFVYPKAVTASITNQRADLRNFADRLEIHRRIDAELDRYGADELKLRKCAKFMNHDLLLYVRGLRSRDQAYREAFLTITRDYISGLDTRVFDECNEIPAIVGFMILKGDYEAAVAAIDYSPGKGQKARLSVPLTERDGRIYWSADYLDTELGRRILDVTDLGIHSLPLGDLTLGGRVTKAEKRDKLLHIEGDVVNPLGRIAADAQIKGVLEFRDRGRAQRLFRVPVNLEHAGDAIEFTADVDTARKVRPLGLIDQSWNLRLQITVGDATIEARLAATEGAAPDEPSADKRARSESGRTGAVVPLRPRLTRLAGDGFQVYVPEAGELSFRIVARRWPATMSLSALKRLAATSRGRRMVGGLLRRERTLRSVLTRRKTKIAVFNRVLVRLPIKKHSVVFESHLGKQYSDNPKYIYEELLRSGKSYKAIWAYETSSRGFPKTAKLVKRGSWAYFRALARAEIWVDNQGFPQGIVKRPKTTYVQTWHGSAYKRMGFDEPEVKAGTLGEHQRRQRMIDRYDAFVIRSEHDAETLVKGMRVNAELIRSGYPRNDPLVRAAADGGAADGADSEAVAKLRKSLKLTDGRKVVLYAPTFRADENGRPSKRFEMPFDPEEFTRELGDTHILLIRAHYLNSVVLPPSLRGTVRDVSKVFDVTTLMLASDALVTDYSSVMFDYALLDRPMAFFVSDLGEYGRSRGSYFDLAAHAPGPVISEPAELFAALGDLDGLGTRHAKQRRQFVEHFGEYDRGDAAEQIVKRFFGGSSRA